MEEQARTCKSKLVETKHAIKLTLANSGTPTTSDVPYLYALVKTHIKASLHEIYTIYVKIYVQHGIIASAILVVDMDVGGLPGVAGT